MPKKTKKTTLPKELTTVTPLSKLVALIVFIALPFIAFYYGVLYQSSMQTEIAAPPILQPAVLSDK